MNRSNWGCLGLVIGLYCALCYTTTQLSLSSPNERSRIYLTVAMFEQHIYQIDQVRLRFGPVLDEAQYGSHFFSDKAPGASLLALVPYAVSRLFVASSAVGIEASLGVMRFGLMAPFGIAAFWALQALAISIGIRPGTARFAALAVALASPAFHYSAALFGHQIVGTCFITALLWMVGLNGRTGSHPKRHAFFAGMAMGCAGITEYQAILGIVAFTVFFVVSHWRRPRLLFAYVLGGLPFALWLGHYHSICFGGPFELSYHHLTHPMLAELHRQGIGGVWLPNRRALWGILFSLHRGLLATSPHFFLAPLGLWCLWRRGKVALAVLLGSMILLEIGFVAGSATWEAGWGYGPRLLVPLIPMLGLLLAEALEHASDHALEPSIIWGVAGSALLVALLSFQAVTTMFPEPPNELINPWLDVVVPLGQANAIAPNLMTQLLGLRGWWSLLPLVGLLLGFVTALVTIATRAVGSRVWVKWLPLFPAMWLVVILTRGHSSDPSQRAEFVQFARSLASNMAPLPE